MRRIKAERNFRSIKKSGKRAKLKGLNAGKLFRLANKNKYYPLFRFVMKFNIFAIPLYFLLFTQWQSGFLISTTAEIVFFFLSVTGLNPVRYGDVISVAVNNGTWGALINWDCVGWKSIMALFALIFATELPTRTKVRGFLLLAPLLYVINIARIWFIFWYVATYDIASFAFVHAVVWSWGLIAAVAVLWLLWFRLNTLKI